MRWYGNSAVRYVLGVMGRNRETIWSVYPKSGDKPFFVRKCLSGGTNHVEYWLDTLHYEYNSIGGFISTNLIDWDVLPSAPPPYRTKARKEFDKEWKKYLIPVECNKMGLRWEDIFIGKSLLFDFDDKKYPMKAYRKAEKVAVYLLKEHSIQSTIIFSGNKGFHIFVDPASASILTGVVFDDFKGAKDPLREIGQIYARAVVELSKNAGVSYSDEDRSPNYRQGIHRMPYSIHPKSGQVVWPLNEKNIKSVRVLSDDSNIIDIAKALHSWDIPCQSGVPDDDRLTYITPEYQISNRGLPKFKIIEGFK